MRIAISGFTGSGVTTATRLVGETLYLNVANYTFHDLAIDLKVAFQDLQFDLIEREFPKYDLLLDKKQVERAIKGNCVIGSRLAVWSDSPQMLERLEIPREKWFKFDFKVWLDAPLETRARRVAQREKTSFEKALSETRARDDANAARYEKLYGIDVSDFARVVDLVVDAGRLDARGVTDKIVLECIKKKTGLREKRGNKSVELAIEKRVKEKEES